MKPKKFIPIFEGNLPADSFIEKQPKPLVILKGHDSGGGLHILKIPACKTGHELIATPDSCPLCEMQAKLDAEIQRRFDGNRIASQENAADYTRLQASRDAWKRLAMAFKGLDHYRADSFTELGAAEAALRAMKELP